MYAHSSPHPTAETLEAYGAGKLDDVLAEAVAGHLEDCPECRRRVAEMAPDTFLGRLRDAGVRPEAIASDRRSTPHGPAMEPGRTVADPAAATDPSVPDPGVAALPTVGLASRPSGPRSGSGASDEPTRDPLATGESPVVSETANNAAEDGQDEAGLPGRDPDPLLRRLRAAEGAGRGRHGGRLQGPPGQPQPARRPEDDPGRPVRRRRRGPPVPERGRGRRPARPPRHRADLRGRRARGPALLQHEADRGREPRRAAEGLRRRSAARGRGWWRRRPRRSTTPTSGASSTAT